MNISLENVDKVSALLSIKMEKADYQEKVKKALKNFCQKANVPGFRPGKVPMAMVEKLYGTDVKAEEVNKLLSETLYEYIRDNKINMLGEPLSSDKQPDFDIVKEDSFEFLFDIALAPEFKAELAGEDVVDYYSIEVDDKMIDSQVRAHAQRGGSHIKVETYQAKDMLKGSIAELDENGSTKEGGIQLDSAILMPDYFKNDDQKAIFNDCKLNDILVFCPAKAYEGSDTEIAAFLKIEKEEVANYSGNFSYQITEITRFEAAEVNQTLFDQVFGEGAVSSEEEFRAKIKEGIENQYVADSDYKFLLDVRTYLTNKIGKLEFPDALLKKIMLANNKDKEESYVEENYDKSIEELSWHLIKEQLVKANSIKINDEDLKETAKDATRFQFAQYGMASIPEEILENYAAEMLKKKDQVEGLVQRCVDAKLSIALKSVVKLNEKKVSIEDFNKMFE